MTKNIICHSWGGRVRAVSVKRLPALQPKIGQFWKVNPHWLLSLGKIYTVVFSNWMLSSNAQHIYLQYLLLFGCSQNSIGSWLKRKKWNILFGPNSSKKSFQSLAWFLRWLITCYYWLIQKVNGWVKFYINALNFLHTWQTEDDFAQYPNAHLMLETKNL
jgi:hypothetical protein